MFSKTFIFITAAIFLALLAVLLLLLGNVFRQAHDDGLPLARVEDLTVTLKDLKEQSLLNYFSLGEAAERWIDEQVLLQHANRSNYFDRSLLSTRLKEYERRVIAGLVIDSLLLRYIRIDPEVIREYYSNNLHDFQFQDSAALVIHLCFHSVDDAREALKAFRASPSLLDSLLGQYNYDRHIAYRHRLMPALDLSIFSAVANQFSGPVSTDFGYHIFLVERFFHRGDTIPFSFVRKYIYEHSFQQQLPLVRSTILDSLREMLNIEIYHD